ncbi:slipin family protein [Undibacterium pigrum]|uniref:SPFH domain-containing protein n=1 Tax=Undibacterium pigrum TaxID=401470 RepID=A0A318J603_9BURK|nr:slipin family protein [Undibacterium pigrum]PXX42582.1 SPFH domain-containing protein [Undibacterium pigrum]
MFLRKIIQDHQIGLLYGRSGFEKILAKGSYFLPRSKRVELGNLTDFPANIADLEWISSHHGAALATDLEIVRTGHDEVALVCSGQQFLCVTPNSLRAFWKQGLGVKVFRANITPDLKVPDEWLKQIPIGVSVGCVKQVTIPAGAYGLLFAEESFSDFLLPGRHAYFDVLPKTKLTICRQSQVIDAKDVVHAIVASAHPVLSTQLNKIETSDQQLAVWWDKNELVHVTGQATPALASSDLTLELISLAQAPRAIEDHIVLAMRSNANNAKLLAPHITSYEVPSEHVGMLYIDGVFHASLKPGFYAYWHGGNRLSLTVIDTRLTTLEITGQEMLTQDKVPLRVNVTAGYKITDAPLMLASLNDYKDFIYKEIQFALRAAVGGKTLDGLLENKNETDEQILHYVAQKAQVQGIEIVSLGIKDLILPGEIKTMLGKVVEAEKAAQANVIRRREETAATRSLMNTSRVMEDNPVALRLKELETLEKMTEKIDKISVYGGLESLLKQVAAFKPAIEK